MPKVRAHALSLTHYVAPSREAAIPSRRWLGRPALLCSLALLAGTGAAALLAVAPDENAPVSLAIPPAFEAPLLADLRGMAEDVSGPQDETRRAVETRMRALRDRQEILTVRQERLASLLKAAEARKVVIEPGAVRDPRERQPLVLARLERRPVAGPQPIPASGEALAVRDFDRPPAVRRADELDAALAGLERTQDAIMAALEEAMETRIERLAKVPAELGLAAPEEGIGGPVLELRGVDVPLQITDRFEIFEAALGQIDELGRVVDALPVRLPLVGDTRVSSNYGRRQDPFLGRPAMHTGIDLAAPRGAKVRSAGSGTVRFAGWNGGYGRMIEIDHGNGHRTRYGHLSKIKVSEGDVVEAGAVIGAVGSSGRSTGPHLHYEMVRDGRRRDPSPYLDVAKLLGEEI